MEEATEVDNDVELESIPLNEIAINEEYEGIVQNVVSYGAFVDIGAEVSLSQQHPSLLTRSVGYY